MKRLITCQGRYLQLALLTGALCCSGCDMLESHPYDVKITGERGLTAKNVALIEDQMAGRDQMRFAMISDTQGWYDETEDVVKALNARGDLDFVVHGGDLSDYGATREFLWQRDILNNLEMPWVTVIGNHDCLGTGEDVYLSVFGELNYAFSAGDTRFLCLNTNALEYDYSKPVPDFDFIENEIKNAEDNGVKRTIVLMHVRPGELVFNNNVQKVFQLYIKMMPGLQFCLYGHEHQLLVSDLFDDGLLYYQCPNIAKRIYLLFTLNADGTYDYEAVDF
ncbi:MAG: metallophosphoesterase [Bacteroidales bacterium]|nr:metallophosphoesterase [Bacteroidales bacterium]